MGNRGNILLWTGRKAKKIIRQALGIKPAREIPKKKIKILLLTNRDSDNVGDQVIEACDIALLKAVEKNLCLEDSEFQVMSRAASIVTQKYLATKEEKLLESAEKVIRDSDVVVFGGAPVFNYLYQIFYERTAVTLEIAQKYGKPVIFSAIGVERYDENDAKCQRLKGALNLGCVQQVTTRDGIEKLVRYKEKEDSFVTAKVSDPAVFTQKVFEKFLSGRTENTKKERKKIGIFILRANGFVDNKLDFDREQSVGLWLELMQQLKEKGYDYELMTSGHFGDEAFLDYLIRECGVKDTDCLFNVNTPEILIEKISGCDAVISCRMHPSIISFALGVPSIGIVWNPKVKYFYDSIGYAGRVVEVADLRADVLVSKVEEALEEGIEKDQDYLVSVYRYLYTGIRKALGLDGEGKPPYTYEELIDNLPAFEGTSEKEKINKLRRKFRRIYQLLNKRFENVKTKTEKIRELEKELERLKQRP